MEYNVRVLNYTPSGVAVSTSRDRSILIHGCVDGTPGFEYLPVTEVEYINSTSPVFRNGTLEFEEADREKMYARLSIPDWQERCVFQRDIDGMLLRPSLKIMEKMVKVSDVVTMERIRGRMIWLLNHQKEVSVKARELVDARMDELNKGVRQTKISIKHLGDKDEYKDPKVELEQEVQSLREQLDAMREQMAATAPAVQKEEPVEVAPPAKPVPAKRPSGRKPAAKK